MSRIDKKIATCERWLEAMRPHRTEPNNVRFSDDFQAFVNAFGSIRQYLIDDLKLALDSASPTPQQHWLQDIEDDIDVATIIGLRDSEYHVDVVETATQVVHVLPPTVLTLRGGLRMQLMRPDGTVEPEIVIEDPPAQKRGDVQTQPEIIWTYRVDPDALPPTFMLARSQYKGRVPGTKLRQIIGNAEPHKGDVLMNLKRWDLVNIADRALRIIRDAVRDGRSAGVVR